MLLFQLFLCEPFLLEGSPKFCSALQPFFGVPVLVIGLTAFFVDDKLLVLSLDGFSPVGKVFTNSLCC